CVCVCFFSWLFVSMLCETLWYFCSSVIGWQSGQWDAFLCVGVLATRLRRGQVKMGEGLRAKLLRLDELSGVENDVMEPKRKRSFPGNGTPLDRLSVSSMETKQSKAVALPRRRVSPPPIDRIGMSRLPMSRG
uniref:Osteocrin n=1 Tax=Salarias fasciatus TaxID=181472 RepID=A0A672H8V1_SALFA